MIHILYSGKTEPTASRLTTAIHDTGIDCQSHRRDTIPNLLTGDLVINWGRRLASTPTGVHYLNKLAPHEKPTAMEMLDNAGILVPTFMTGALIVRGSMTAQGGQVNVRHNSFCTEFIPKKLELRMDVLFGRVFRLHVKRGPAQQAAWNRHSDIPWVTFGPQTMVEGSVSRFSEYGLTTERIRDAIGIAKNAVDALGYDFGAPDIILGEDGSFYTLEVNSAPGLNDPGVKKWASRIAQHYHNIQSEEEVTDEEI